MCLVLLEGIAVLALVKTDLQMGVPAVLFLTQVGRNPVWKTSQTSGLTKAGIKQVATQVSVLCAVACLKACCDCQDKANLRAIILLLL